MVVDARGQGCPKPVMMAAEALSKITKGSIDIIVDNEAAAENVAMFTKMKSFHSETVREGNDWRVRIMKGSTCAAPQIQNEPEEAGKPLLVIIGTDTMGKDESLGKILMKGYFETMRAYKEVPHTIFFLNAGVRLTTVDEEIVAILKDIEAIGVKIYSCGTCLKHYDLEKALQVGYRGTTNHIIEGIKDFEKTVWIG